MIIHRIGKKKYNIYAFDIESHNDTESIAKRETSMWLGAFINDDSKIDDEASYIYNMEEFIAKMEEIVNPKRKSGKESRKCKNLCVYIYNLSFEWSFLLPVLISKGYHFEEEIGVNSEYCYNTVSTRSCSSVWEVHLKMNKTSGDVRLRDLAKIYGGGLANVAKAFNLPTQKGEIDYRLNRLHNHIVTKEEKEYCFKDTRILIDIILKVIENGDKDFFNVISMASYATKKMVKCGWPHDMTPFKRYRELYPELDATQTAFLRNGVEGGITYAPAMWQFKDIQQPILHIDAHQMHPSQAYLHMFPYGEGTYFTGEPNPFMICACRIRISYVGVKLHSIIKLIGIDFIDDLEITVWDFEIPTMKKCYNELKIDYIDGYAYKFRRLPWRQFYANNYKARLIAKKNKDAYNTLYYKLLNNSSYGKLLEKPHNQIIANCIGIDEIITSDVIDKPLEECHTQAKYTYLPVGSAIPAYSRVQLIETALLFGWKKIVYFDTDSIFVLWDEQTREVWESNKIDKTDFLGGWALEEMIDRAQFTAPKRYKVITAEGNFYAKMAGINNISHEVPYDEINIISSEWDVQRAYRVKGGTIIDIQRKQVTVQKKYKDIYESNTLQDNRQGV